MLAVTQITDPGLQGPRIMLADMLAVGEDVGFTADGGPLARAIDEGDVDLRIIIQLVRLA